MRRLISVFAAVVLLAVCVFSVSAAISAPEVSSHGTVARDGKCQVTMIAMLSVDEVRSDLEFPVPVGASSVRVNGSTVVTKKSGDVRIIDLDRELGRMTGEFTISINYTIQDVIHTNDTGALELRLPLLSGFSYEIEAMDFTVTLPDVFETLPSFESGYHQQNIERDIAYTVEGNVIKGSFTQALKDHETVTMKLLVTDEMFPQSLADTQDYRFGLTAMVLCGGLAFVYWLLTMRFWPLRREYCTAPPEGYTAGEMDSILGSRGADLSLTVLSWAQMGYIVLHMDKKGVVTVHKRMSMGNERKDSEQKLFHRLFAKGDTVNTRSAYYALLLQKTAEKPFDQALLRKRSGNPKVFRALASGIGLFGGVCIAIAMSGGAFLQILLILLLGALGAASGWKILSWGGSILAPRRHSFRATAVICGLWLLGGLLAGAFSVAVYMVLGLLAAGAFLFFSGLRTDVGKQTAALSMGLRRHLKKADPEAVQRVQEQDSGYFFSLAPYAMALGVDRAFSKRFGKMKIEECPYLITDSQMSLTAKDWMARLHKVTYSMGDRARKLGTERFFAMIRSFRR